MRYCRPKPKGVEGENNWVPSRDCSLIAFGASARRFLVTPVAFALSSHRLSITRNGSPNGELGEPPALADMCS